MPFIYRVNRFHSSLVRAKRVARDHSFEVSHVVTVRRYEISDGKRLDQICDALNGNLIEEGEIIAAFRKGKSLPS